ncbi:unnamed protein product [Caenorhabditis angaria]|uniref:Uncharacterized protein n=1 Tax=Caenorhabditis angaria TaxID=860376 RepID=A0A9P1IWQ2_9PELO|nr:unnamed protein product [Caenorhabditis angaria]
MAFFLDFVAVSETIGAILSLITNSILLTLLLSYKHNKLGTYKYLMISCCFVQMIYSTTNFSSHMRAHSTNASYVLFREYKGSNRKFAPFLLLQFCWMYTTQIAILCIHFFYRYISLWQFLSTSKLHWFDRKRLYLWIALAVFFGFSIVVLKYTFLGENDYLTEHLRYDFAKSYGLRMEEVVYNGPIFYQGLENKKPIGVWVTIGILMFGMMTCYTSMLFFGIMSYIKLKHRKTMFTMSEKTRYLQKQLLIALMIQATIPSLLIYIPAELLFISPVFKLGLGPLANISMCCLAIYPPFDQFGVIYIIKDFRTTLKTFVIKSWTKSTISS